MGEIIEGLGAAERKRIAALRASGGFFWIDASVAETSRDELGVGLSIPAYRRSSRLVDFSARTPPSRNFHADGQHVAFAFSCFLEVERRPTGEAPRPAGSSSRSTSWSAATTC